MKPILECKKIMGELGLPFIETLDEYLTNGWVYSGDDAFVMAMPESSWKLFELNLNKEVDKDTWFVYAYIGNLKRVLELIPFPLEYVAFRRNNGKIKMYEFYNLMAKIRM